MVGDNGDWEDELAEGRDAPFEFHDDLTRRVIAVIIRVHQTLGPGFIESVYHRALTVELKRAGIPFSTEHELEIRYEGEIVGVHRLDLLVSGQLIVELKAIEELTKAHYSQLRSYIKAANLSVGLLVNFSKEKADYRRVTPQGPRSGR